MNHAPRPFRAALRAFVESSLIAAAIALGPAAWVGFAQSEPASTEVDQASTLETTLPQESALRASLDALQAQDLSEDDPRYAALGLYASALEGLASIEADREREAASRVRIAAAPDELAQVEAALAAPPSPGTDPSTLTSPELELLVTELNRAAEGARAARTESESESERRRAQLESLPQQLGTLRAEQSSLAAPPVAAPDDPPELTNARLDADAVERARIAAAIAAAEAQLSELTATSELHSERERLIDRRAQRASARALEASQILDARRVVEAEIRAKEAQTQAERAERDGSALAPLADDVALLTGEVSLLTQRLTDIKRQAAQTRSQRQQLEQSYRDTLRRADVAGLSNLIGTLLRDERRRMIPASVVSSSVRECREAIARRQLREIEVKAVIESLGFDIDRRAETYLLSPEANRGAELTEVRREALSPRVVELLSAEDEALRELREVLSRLVSALTDLQTEQQLLVQSTEQYSNFINERVLWVRSAAPMWRWRMSDNRGSMLARLTSEVEIEPVNLATHLGESTTWLISPTQWSDVGSRLLFDIKSLPSRWILYATMLLALFLLRPIVRSRLDELADVGSGPAITTYRPMLAAIAHTVAIAAWWPLLITFVGWRLRHLAAGDELAAALGAAARPTAVLVFALELLRVACRPRGLLRAHLGLEGPTTRRLRGLLLLFSPIFIFAVASLWTLEAHSNESYLSTLGRVLFIPATVLLALAGWKVVRAHVDDEDKEDDADQVSFETHGGSFVRRLAGVVRALTLVLVPVIALLAIFGYVFTAVQLFDRLLLTLGFLIALALILLLALRLVEITKRRIAAARIREELAAKIDADSSAPADAAETSDEPASERANLTEVSAQLRQLLATVIGFTAIAGVYLIWIEVIPALGIFRSVELWTVTETSPLTVFGSSDAPLPNTSEVAVTLADVGMAIFWFIALLIAARRLPQLAEVLVLERIGMPSGERFAVKTVARYALTLIGVLLALSTIRIGWNDVQFLAAAISVGLGFGLQEIFANFVSGLILLFERPVRIGDYVTIGDVFGRVSKIQIRATTIIDNERRELIVPNKEFVTGELINWTLTDPITRLNVDVGVAYGSDTDKARKILGQVARRTRGVVKEPPPEAYFLGFGDSTLNFSLFVYINDRSTWMEVLDRLHQSIDTAFRREDIEISFPQRDLHVRTAPALDFLLQRQIGDSVDEAGDAETPSPSPA